MSFATRCFTLPLPSWSTRFCSRQVLERYQYFRLKSSPGTFQKCFTTQYKRDITLYRYERQTFYKILGLASFSQLAFWSYMSYTMYAYVRPASQMLQEHKLKSSLSNSEEFVEFKYFPKFLLSSKAQTAVSLASLGVGIVFCFCGCVYALRSVNRLLLTQNGVGVVVKTYTPFGRSKQFSVPLHEVSCVGHRLDHKLFSAGGLMSVFLGADLCRRSTVRILNN